MNTQERITQLERTVRELKTIAIHERKRRLELQEKLEQREEKYET